MLTYLILVGFRSSLICSGVPTKNTECVTLHFGACHMLRPSYTYLLAGCQRNLDTPPLLVQYEYYISLLCASLINSTEM